MKLLSKEPPCSSNSLPQCRSPLHLGQILTEKYSESVNQQGLCFLCLLRVCERQPFLFLGKPGIVPKQSPCLYVCALMCVIFCGCTTCAPHGLEARPAAPSVARGGLRWGQGREQLLSWEPRVGLTCPSPPPGFCLEVWLHARGMLFPLCILAVGWFLWFLSPVLHVCMSHQRPRGSPQLPFTPPAKFSQRRGAPAMPLLTLAARHLPPLPLHPGQSGNSLIA